jgi:hypothetical protein
MNIVTAKIVLRNRRYPVHHSVECGERGERERARERDSRESEREREREKRERIRRESESEARILMTLPIRGN